MDIDFIFALCLSSAILALTYDILYRRVKLSKRVSVVIALAFAIITYLFLRENPDVLEDTVTKIALALLGALVALATLVKKKAGE
jgi:uncharacterized membrane protein